MLIVLSKSILFVCTASHWNPWTYMKSSYCFILQQIFSHLWIKNIRVQETTTVSVSPYAAPERGGTIINNLQASAKPSVSAFTSASQKSNWKSLVPNQPSSPFIFCCVCMCQLTLQLFCTSNPVHKHSHFWYLLFPTLPWRARKDKFEIIRP